MGDSKQTGRAKTIRRPALRDVAQAANVSLMTASRAINGSPRVARETRARVLVEAERLGYRPSLSARSLRTNQTGLIGVSTPDLMMPLQIEVVLGARDAAAHEGYRLLLDVDMTHDGGRHPFTADGELLIATAAHDPEYGVQHDPGKTVNLMGKSSVLDVCGTDLDRATFAAYQQLASSGYRRIALLAHHDSPSLQGFAQATRELEIAGDAHLVQVVGNDQGSVSRAIDRLMSSPEAPDAIVVVNVAGTPLALRALGRRGISVGRDVAFIGTEPSLAEWGDLVSPKMSAIRVPGYEIGAAGARRLIARIRGDSSPPQHHLFPSELVIRESTPRI